MMASSTREMTMTDSSMSLTGLILTRAVEGAMIAALCAIVTAPFWLVS
jgi:hypothetical protein